MSEDEKFDRWIRETSRDYHQPPAEVPREAMWSSIRTRLDAHEVLPEAGDTVPPAMGASLVVRRDAGSSRAGAGSQRWWQYAAAAVLLLAVGIGIGRNYSGREPSAPSVEAASGDSAPEPSTVSYDVATVQHFTRAEALLTSFRAGHDDGGAAFMDRWARDLLGDTRLLLDSPAGADARRRALLEDLEFVLAQIVQLPTESTTDRSLVRSSIERAGVLTRIRSNIPAGTISGT
ncbi:MAG: hypothetical protein ABIZ91_07295 [Gemmatimonadaceae bacterium]